MADITVDGELSERGRDEILCTEALAFLAELHERFDPRRRELVAAREERSPARDFLAETAEVRQDPTWQVAPPRGEYADRRVEITGPTDAKLVINALNSGAQGFMADFEDANSPTWHNQVEGQANLIDALEGTLTHQSSDGRRYVVKDVVTDGAGDDGPATLLVRPRGWHLPERHLRTDGGPLGGALVDFGLYAFHNARRLADRGSGLFCYLPKIEHHLEARLWDDVFTFTEDALGLQRGDVRATVLIETLPAAFQMDEILYELAEHSYGLNAGRWDYIFSTIKTYRHDPAFVLPDRDHITMTVPFMRAYTELLVRTCHRRGAFAMGGMAALIPSRTDPEANERAITAVAADKRREAEAGFDGTWVAHPDVVSVAAAAFDEVLGGRANQIDTGREDVHVTAADLLDVSATPGAVTEAGIRKNLNVGFQYLSFWLGGRGAAGINGLMEDAATAEISRSQIWQWIHHGAILDDGRVVTRELVADLLADEMAAIRAEVGEATWQAGRPEVTRQVFEEVAMGQAFPPFLTEVAYPHLD